MLNIHCIQMAFRLFIKFLIELDMEETYKPVWIRLWIVSEVFWEKFAEHWSHSYGFSPIIINILNNSYPWKKPVWMHLWTFKIFSREKADEHWLHLNGFSPINFNKFIVLHGIVKKFCRRHYAEERKEKGWGREKIQIQ